MPKVTPTTPKALRPYTAHGVDFSDWEGKDKVEGTCPFCNDERKFCVYLEESRAGQYNCVKCGEGGHPKNAYGFIRRLWEESDKLTHDYDELAEDRRLLDPLTLSHWGVCRSTITGEWLVPGYNAAGEIVQLFRYLPDHETGKRILLPTPDLHDLEGTKLGYFRPTAEWWTEEYTTLWVLEGPWDAMAFWELAVQAKTTEDGLRPTANQAGSLLAGANVIAVPGAGNFASGWTTLLAGRAVRVLYDNDYPKDNRGKVVEGAGILGMRKVVQLAAKLETPPTEVQYLHWGDSGYDKDLASGYDVRDWLTRV